MDGMEDPDRKTIVKEKTFVFAHKVFLVGVRGIQRKGCSLGKKFQGKICK